MQALLAGFKELHKRYNINPNPLQYADPFPWQSGNQTPLALAIDAIVEAGMIPNMSINLYTDKRVRLVNICIYQVVMKLRQLQTLCLVMTLHPEADQTIASLSLVCVVPSCGTN